MLSLKISLLTLTFLVISKADSTEEQLLVLLKSGVTESELLQDIPGDYMAVVGRQFIGRNVLLTVEPIQPSVRSFLAGHPLIQVVEPNARTSLVDPIAFSYRAASLVEDDFQQPTVKSAVAEQCHEDSINGTETWGLTRTSYRDRPEYETDPYRYSYNGSGVDIYILSTGIDVDHVEFTGRASHGFVSPAFVEGRRDFLGHGTTVASLAGGRIYGIAKNANLISVKIFSQTQGGTYGIIIDGLNYVTERVKEERSQGKKPRAVIVTSIGGSTPSDIWYNAIEDAVQEGITVIAFAGLLYPASFDNVITVGATDLNDIMANFYNNGPDVDISAPGANLYSAASTFEVGCESITPYYCVGNINGTAGAASLVAGVVARYLEQLSDSELRNVYFEGIRDMLIETSTKNKITFSSSDQNTTPNRLLYKNCGRTDFTLPEPCWNCRDSGGAQISSVCLVFLMNFLAFADRIL